MKLSTDTLRIALLLLIVLNVSRVHQNWLWLAKLRPAMLLTAIVLLYAFLNPRLLNPEKPLKSWPARVIIALAFWACISVPFSISMGASGSWILNGWWKVLAACFLLMVATRDIRDFYTFIFGYVLASGILGYMALFQFKVATTFSKEKDFAYERIAEGTLSWDPNDISCVLAVGLPLALLLLQAAPSRMKLLCGPIIVLIGGAIARSGSRGGLLGLVAVGVALLLAVSTVPLWKRLAVIGMVAGGLSFWAPRGYWNQMATILSPEKDYNYDLIDGRRKLAQRGIKYMLAYPIFGVGIGNFPKAECLIGDAEKRRFAMQTGYNRCTPPHNSFIQAGAELGVIGGGLWVSLLAGGVISMLRLRRKIPPRWARGTPEQRFLFVVPQYLICSIAGFAVTAFFLSFAWLDIYYLLGAFLTGALVCVERELRLDAASLARPGEPRVGTA